MSVFEFWNIDFHFFALLSQLLIPFYHSIDINTSFFHIFDVFCLKLIKSSRSLFVESLTCFKWILMSSIDVAIITQSFDVVCIACKSVVFCFIDDVACVNRCFFCCFSTTLARVSISCFRNQLRKFDVFIIQLLLADSLLFCVFSHKKKGDR